MDDKGGLPKTTARQKKGQSDSTSLAIEKKTTWRKRGKKKEASFPVRWQKKESERKH